MHASKAWQDELRKNGWIDAFETGPRFQAYLKMQENRVESTLKELGLV